MNFVGSDKPATSILIAAVGGMMCLLFLVSVMAILTYNVFTSSSQNCHDDDDGIICDYDNNNKAEHLVKESLESSC